MTMLQFVAGFSLVMLVIGVGLMAIASVSHWRDLMRRERASRRYRQSQEENRRAALRWHGHDGGGGEE